MKTLSRFRSWLRSVAHRSRLEREMGDELRFHVEERSNELIRGGLPPARASRQARVEFGAVEARKEEMREAVGLRLLDKVRVDLRYAFRQLRRSSGFSAVAVLSLALGIGANTAIFSLVNSVILRSLPVAEPQRLVTISAGPSLRRNWPYATWEQIRQRSQAFDGALAWSAEQLNLAQGGEKQPVDGLYVSGEFFKTLGVPPLLGRTFTSADEYVGADPTVR